MSNIFAPNLLDRGWWVGGGSRSTLSNRYIFCYMKIVALSDTHDCTGIETVH
jgi:hypothetical protein